MRKLETMILALLLILPLLTFGIGAMEVQAEQIDVAIDESNFPDEVFRSYVAENFDKDGDGCLSEAECLNVWHVSVNNMGITSVKGIEHFDNMYYLECQVNPLQSLDVSQNPGLESLWCADTGITELDLSNNPLLRQVVCGDNALAALDLSGLEQSPNYCVLSGQSICIDGALESFDLSNLPGFDASRAYNWRGAEYDAESNTISNFASEVVTYEYDCGSGYSMNVALMRNESGVALNDVYFPDAAFRNHLSQNVDADGDGFLSMQELREPVVLRLSGGVESLQGLEYLLCLEQLYCRYQNISSLDLAVASNVMVLNLEHNPIRVLDLACFPNVNSLDCTDCTELYQINFYGDAPYFSEEAFLNVEAVAYYPEGNETWTEEVLLDYGGIITWRAYDPDDHVHEFEEDVTAPICEEQGYTTFTCVCGESYHCRYTDGYGHCWDAGAVIAEPTELAQGVKRYTCQICGETKDEGFDRTIAQGEAVSLPDEIIAHTNQQAATRQYACEAVGGIYFLVDEKLNLLDLDTGSIRLVYEFPEKSPYVYACGDMLYWSNDGYIIAVDLAKGALDHIGAFLAGSNFNDLYTYFDEESYTAVAGEATEFSVNGHFVFGSGQDMVDSSIIYQVDSVPYGATVTATCADEVITATVDEDGKFEMTFPSEGTYTILVNGTCSFTPDEGWYAGQEYTDAPVVPAMCTVEVSKAPLQEGTPEKVVEDFNLEMSLNSWIDMDLTQYFTDPEGEELTYYISTDAENWDETPAQFRYYASGDGTRYVYFQAADAEHTSQMLTVTTVVPEVPNKVTVNFSISMGTDKFYQGGVNDTVMVPVSLTVPYFDLALYGMDECYYNPQCYATANGELGSGTMGDVESADGVVTVMHVYIYATEHLYLGYSVNDCGKGKSYDMEQDCIVDADGKKLLSWTGTAGSTYMSLWNHGTNLNYYVDWTYPLGGPKWGSTSDQIALYGGEEIAIHNIEDANVQGSNFAFFTLDGGYEPASQADTVTVYQGDELALTAVRTVPDWDAYTTGYTGNETELYYVDVNAVVGNINEWNVLGSTDADGNAVIDTTDIAPGTYYVAAEGFVDTYTATETAPAIIKLTVKAAPQDVAITVTQGEEMIEAVDTGLLYSDTKVYFAELPAYANYSINDDLGDKLGTVNRYYMRRVAFPLAVNASDSNTNYDNIISKYGQIEDLTSENTKLNAFEVSAVHANGWGRGALQYVLIVEEPVFRVESVTLDQSEVKTWGGNQVQLTATVAPENASFPSVTWSSDNTNVAQVDGNGLVSCWLDGTATITATADGVSATCTITVVDGVPIPTKVYSGSDWPIRGNCVSGITVQKVQVTNTLVNGSNYYITLSEKTADDAVFTLVLDKSGSDGVFVKIGDEWLSTDPKAAIPNQEFTLENGARVVKIGTSAYWNYTEYPDYVYDSRDSNGSFKTFYFSNNGIFPMAPMLTGGNSAAALRVQDETYTIDLTPLFNNISDSEMTYQVSIDGAEAVACDANYTYTCDTYGTRKLVFNAVNEYGTSPAYTVTITVIPKTAVNEINHAVKAGTIKWIAYTDDQGNPLPEGTTFTWDAETTTATLIQPTDINKTGKVITYYLLEKDDPSAKLPLLTSSTIFVGAGTYWDKGVRDRHTVTLNNGFANANTYLYEREPRDPNYETLNEYKTIKFVYERVLPETAFEYKVEDGSAKYTFQSDNGGVNGHSWITTGKNNEVHIALTDATPDDGLITCVERSATTTLVDGAGEVKYSTGSSFWGDLKNWTIKYQKDQFPAFAEGIEAAVEVTMPCLNEYTVDLAAMYTDPDADDTLTYEVKLGEGAWTAIEGSTYTFIPETKQDYTLQLRCYDGFVYSTDVQTVNITATNAITTYEATVNVNAENAEFYCFTAVTEEEGITWNDQITGTKNMETGDYTLAVPVNVSKLVVKIGEALNVVELSAEKNTASLAKVDFSIETLAGDAAQATVAVTAPESMIQPVGEGNVYYLIPGEGYTFTAVPTEEFSNIWTNAVLKEQTVEADATVDVVLPVRGAKTITIDSDAELKVYYQRGYYVLSEVEPAVVTENENLTTTYIYPTPKTNAYSMGYMYFAKKDGLIDKAGYMMGKSEFNITWRGDERTGDYRAEYDPGYGQGSRGDDSVLVNINSQNHLVLKEGETFRLRSSRIWEIINTDTENVMIEPEYVYSNYDESIITLTNANEVLTDRVCGTGGNNWMDITVTGKGVTFLEVAYEAVHLVDGYEAGGWGGAGAATSNFTWNAIDPDRTALIVVQTDGMAATDVTFNIDCLSANVKENVYEAESAVQWDAEFDTLYFLGESRELTLAPTAKEGKIVSVAISSDKGESWTELTSMDGVYTAEIFAGNNIIRVTKEDGTTAYQLVRGDKIEAEVTVVNDVNGDGKVGLGDTVKLQLHGLHFPVGKMSGIYNPGFSWGHRITYTLDGQTVQQYDQYQYNFISNAYMTFTIPTDVAAEYVLEDGYINFNIFGDGPGNHRNLTDSGRQVNTSASSAKYCRSLLPEIVIYSCEHAVTEKGKVVAPTCTVEGYTEYSCADCGTVVKGEKVDALGHSYEAVVKEATCVEVGYTTYTCACGESYVDGIVNALGHKTSSVVTKPTHDKMGFTTTKCEICDYEFVHSWTDAIEHEYVKTVTKEATCTAEGEVTFKCECSASYTQALPMTGHSCEATVVAATCTAYGYTSYKCKNCDYGYINQLVNPVGHKYESSVTAPTCTEEGYTTYTCAVCKDSYTADFVAALGHKASVVNAKEATGHEEGYTGDKVCTVCKAELEKGQVISAAGCPSASFADVSEKDWFHEAADFVVESKLMNGTSATTFAPNAETTRAMMATLLYRVAGEPSIEGAENPFEDVAEDAWYYKAVVWAAKTGVVSGTSETTFAPDAMVTREQMVTMLWRFADKPVADKEELKGYTDAKEIGSYAEDAFAWAIGQGLITGTTETQLSPKGTATRAQIAIILMRYLAK